MATDGSNSTCLTCGGLRGDRVTGWQCDDPPATKQPFGFGIDYIVCLFSARKMTRLLVVETQIQQ